MGTNHQHHQQSNFLIKKLITWAIYAFLPLVVVHFYFFPHSLNQLPFPTNTPPKKNTIPIITTPISSSSQGGGGGRERDIQRRTRCDYSVGRWVQDTRGPRYNGTSCDTIRDKQNCMVNGRPDTSYLYWRWKPKECKLHNFDPAAFLRLIKNKHLAFVGDSLARNQLDSLICLLSTTSPPNLIYRDDGEHNRFRRWSFPPYNATVSVFWSPFLVKGIEQSVTTGRYYNELYMDSIDQRWASELDGIDLMVFSVGQWFINSAVYFEGDSVLGCHLCPKHNHTEIGFYDIFRKVIRSSLSEVMGRRSVPSSDKLMVVVTVTPSHFEGEWDKAAGIRKPGGCPKKEPYKEGEKEVDQYTFGEMRKIAVEEVEAAAAKERAERGGRLRIEVMDVTNLAMMRPDGHPGTYIYRGNRVHNDCIHWCLPGPIDTWNQILLEMMKRWSDERKLASTI